MSEKREIMLELKPTEKENQQISEILRRFLDGKDAMAATVVPKMFVNLIGIYLSCDMNIEHFVRDAAVFYSMVDRNYREMCKED